MVAGAGEGSPCDLGCKPLDVTYQGTSITQQEVTVQGLLPGAALPQPQCCPVGESSMKPRAWQAQQLTENPPGAHTAHPRQSHLGCCHCLTAGAERGHQFQLFCFVLSLSVLHVSSETHLVSMR